MPKRKKTLSSKSSKPSQKQGVTPKPNKRPVKGTSPRKAGKKRSHDFALSMREKISENWVEIRKY